jgi:hypothetical protein
MPINNKKNIIYQKMNRAKRTTAKGKGGRASAAINNTHH